MHCLSTIIALNNGRAKPNRVMRIDLPTVEKGSKSYTLRHEEHVEIEEVYKDYSAGMRVNS